jgi:hypothetical protein
MIVAIRLSERLGPVSRLSQNGAACYDAGVPARRRITRRREALRFFIGAACPSGPIIGLEARPAMKAQGLFLSAGRRV